MLQAVYVFVVFFLACNKEQASLGKALLNSLDSSSLSKEGLLGSKPGNGENDTSNKGEKGIFGTYMVPLAGLSALLAGGAVTTAVVALRNKGQVAGGKEEEIELTENINGEKKDDCFMEGKREAPWNLKKSEKIVVFSFDGGGVRGVVPLRIVQGIEEELGKKISEIGDLFAGTSAGAINAAILNTPEPDGDGKPLSAEKALEKSKDLMNDVFGAGITWRSLKMGFGLWGSQYDANKLEKHFEKHLGGTKLSQTVKPVVLVSQSLGPKSHTVLFSSLKAVHEKNQDATLAKAVRASTAAPGFFKPLFCQKEINQEPMVLTDGGLGANNPEYYALAQAVQAYPEANDFIVISISTGKNIPDVEVPVGATKGLSGGVLSVIKPTLGALIDGQGSSTNLEELKKVLKAVEKQVETYRIDVELPSHLAAIDNPKNYEALIKEAERVIQTDGKYKEVLQELQELQEGDTVVDQ